MEYLQGLLQNPYAQLVMGVMTGVVVMWLLNRYTEVAAQFAPTLKRLLAMAEEVFGSKYPQVFAVVSGVADSAELAQGGLTEDEMKTIADTMIRQTLVGAQLSDIEIKIAVHLTVYIAEALRDKPQGQVKKAVARLGPK
jgi:hypothetical protein